MTLWKPFCLFRHNQYCGAFSDCVLFYPVFQVKSTQIYFDTNFLRISICWARLRVYSLLLLPAALRLFMWSMAANEFEFVAISDSLGLACWQKILQSPVALCLFCFNTRQHGRQVLYLKLHVDGRKFNYRRLHAAVRLQVVHRWARPWGLQKIV